MNNISYWKCRACGNTWGIEGTGPRMDQKCPNCDRGIWFNDEVNIIRFDPVKDDPRYNQKIEEIKTGSKLLIEIKEQLYDVKDKFYGDFKYNKELERVPEPQRFINKAIYSIEAALKEIKKIEINSL